MLLDQPQGVLGTPAVDEHSGRAVEQRREVAEHQAADEAELAHDEVDVLAGQLPALADALGGVAQRVVRVGDALRGRGRSGGVEHHGQVVGVARDVLVRRVILGQPVHEVGLDREEQRDLVGDPPGTSRAPCHRRSPSSPVALRLRDQRRELSLVEHRRQRRDDDAAVHAAEHRHRRLDRVAAEEDHDVPGLDAALREPHRHADGRPPELIECEDAIVEDQRRLLRVLRGATGKVAPQISVTPVPLGVIAIGFGLERQGRHRLPPLCMLSSLGWRAALRQSPSLRRR